MGVCRGELVDYFSISSQYINRERTWDTFAAPTSHNKAANHLRCQAVTVDGRYSTMSNYDSDTLYAGTGSLHDRNQVVADTN